MTPEEAKAIISGSRINVSQESILGISSLILEDPPKAKSHFGKILLAFHAMGIDGKRDEILEIRDFYLSIFPRRYDKFLLRMLQDGPRGSGIVAEIIGFLAAELEIPLSPAGLKEFKSELLEAGKTAIEKKI